MKNAYMQNKTLKLEIELQQVITLEDLPSVNSTEPNNFGHRTVESVVIVLQHTPLRFRFQLKPSNEVIHTHTRSIVTSNTFFGLFDSKSVYSFLSAHIA